MTKIHFLLGFLIVILAFSLIPYPSQAQTYLVDLSRWDSVFRIPSFAIPNGAITTEATADHFQFNITLSRRPVVNAIAINIQKTNLTFYYQPPLDQELNVSEYDFVNATHAILGETVMVYRPENVVGSYAVYGIHQNNQYGTGKLFHLYRPLLIDATGKTSWATLNVTNNVLTITADMAFLVSAVYPVVIDPIFGYASIGASSETFASSTYEYILGTVFTGAAGTVTEMHMTALRASTGSDNIHVGLYVDGTSTLLADFGDLSCSMATATRWFNWTGLNQVVEAVDYMLVAQGDYTSKQINTNYDTGDANQGHSNQTIAYSAFPASITWSAATTRKRSIYVNYTEGGGGTSLTEQGNFSPTFAFASEKTVTFTTSRTIPFSFAWQTGYAWTFWRAPTIPFSLAFDSSNSYLRAFTQSFSIPFAFSITGTKQATFTTYRTIPFAFTINTAYTQALGNMLGFYGTFTPTFTFTHTKEILFSTYRTIPLSFTLQSAVSVVQAGVLNLFGTIDFTFVFEHSSSGLIIVTSTADLALGLAALAFVIAMSGIGLFALRRRD